MDIGSVLIGLGMLLLFVGPLMLLHFSEKWKKEQLLTKFRQIAAGRGYEIDVVEVWRNEYCLGMDNRGENIIYFKSLQPNAIYEVQPLADVTDCKVAIDSRKIKRDGEVVEVIDRISLSLTIRDAAKSALSLTIFDAESGPGVADELKIAETWKNRISSLIRPARRAA